MDESARRIVFGHPDAMFRAEAGYQFRRLGWETHTAATGPEVRQLARRWRPELVVLSAEFDDESGWLTCAKLLQERPRQRIILLEREVTPRQRRFARHAGAGQVVSERRGMAKLIEAVWGTLTAV